MKTIFKLFFCAGIFIILIGVLAVLTVIFVNKKINSPFRIVAMSQIFEAGIGDGAKKIAADLESQKIISSRNYFLFYLWQTDSAAKLQAGRYSLSAAESIKEIANKIIKGEVIKEEISITIPEGFRLPEIENRFTENKLLKKDDLLNYNYGSTKVAGMYDFLRIDCRGRYCGLEGYLFPDTYNFSTASLPLNRDEVAIKFLDNFELKTKDLRMEAKKREIDFNDIVIMASILEKEVRTPEDMKIVAGILWKRMGIGMPLQVDVAIAYITGKKTGEITYEDLKINSPYNTYLNKGLPPDPISNPGLTALEVALDPAESDYLYYLSKPTGETVFSKTITEHNKAKNLYLK